MNFTTPLASLGFVYKAKKAPLQKLSLITVKDLLYYPPSRYESYPDPIAIAHATPDTDVVVEGTVLSMTTQYTRRSLTIQKAVIQDETGDIECLWFNQRYLTNVIHEGDRLLVAGKVKPGGKKTLQVREYEVRSESPPIHIASIVPVYSETRGLSSKWIRNRIHEVLPAVTANDPLPDAVREKHRLLEITDALRKLHFPRDFTESEAAHYRFSFEELLLKQLAALERKSTWKISHTSPAIEADRHEKDLAKLKASLPFELTPAQEEAVSHILSDIALTKPMNRLLEGDVGSGKTIVAALAAYITCKNGLQSAVMAPTSILAEQHYKTMSNLLNPLGVRVELFTSQKRGTGEFDIAVGTHALIADKLDFHSLGFVVIDEQQRFGVSQRAILREKGSAPHVLTMTATPMPRTILLAAYGDLDVSILNELPKGRKRIKTWLVPDGKRESGYEWIKKEIRAGGQVFIVCPFIEPSESMATVRAATDEFKRLQNDVFTGFRLALLHGKMKAAEKNSILSDFRDGLYDILVTTPVVEVGIDIPNATIMVIETAERFGLSQLHQLRGRVGRNDKEAYCLLFSDNLTPISKKRLSALETVYSGPELAEIDLSLRGPGNMYGTEQHGRLEFKFATFADKSLLALVKREAESLFPSLSDHKLLRDALKSTIIQKVSPD